MRPVTLRFALGTEVRKMSMKKAESYRFIRWDVMNLSCFSMGVAVHPCISPDREVAGITRKRWKKTLRSAVL